jgi:hypothetical protein
MRNMLLKIAALGLALGALAGDAQAEEFVSQYTSADVKKCRKFHSVKIDAETEHAAAWVCKGLAGYVVVISEDDLRSSVTVGRTIKAAGEEPAASQGFASFNSTHNTIEWRSRKGGKPFAIIQRWSVSTYDEKADKSKSNQMLIVTRLPPGPVCHVAYIDVPGNKDANAMARKAADELASKFKCGEDEVHSFGASQAAAAKE